MMKGVIPIPPKALPNYLSTLRIVLSVALFFVTEPIGLFLWIYAIAGLTDAADGFIARKYHFESALGAKLDSLADFIFLAVSLYRMFFSYQLSIPPSFLAICSIVAAIRMVNFIITRIKFRQWGMLHSIGNKAAGLTIFFICPIALLTGQVPFVTVVIPLISAIEETLLLSLSKSYNPNAKSIFHYFVTHNRR